MCRTAVQPVSSHVVLFILHCVCAGRQTHPLMCAHTCGQSQVQAQVQIYSKRAFKDKIDVCSSALHDANLKCLV